MIAGIQSRRSRLALLLVAAGVAACISSGAAGDYHTGTTLYCSDCHVVHYSITHDYTGGADPSGVAGGGPFLYLLKDDDLTALCLACHDGQTFAPDVAGDHGNGYVREAGAITAGVSPYEMWKGHTLDHRTLLTCTSCHAPHGEAGSHPAGSQYRNLRIHPANAPGLDRVVTYAIGTNDTTKDVFERDAGLGQVATHYSYDNVDFNEPDANDSAIGRWCGSCHSDFHGNSVTQRDPSAAPGTGWLFHPEADSDLGAVGGEWSSLATFNDPARPNRVKVMSPTGVWTQPYPSGITPNCLTCHKAHGNRNPFGLIFMSGTGTITEEGDSDGGQFQDLCRQCHVE